MIIVFKNKSELQEAARYESYLKYCALSHLISYRTDEGFHLVKSRYTRNDITITLSSHEYLVSCLTNGVDVDTAEIVEVPKPVVGRCVRCHQESNFTKIAEGAYTDNGKDYNYTIYKCGSCGHNNEVYPSL